MNMRNSSKKIAPNMLKTMRKESIEWYTGEARNIHELLSPLFACEKRASICAIRTGRIQSAIRINTKRPPRHFNRTAFSVQQQICKACNNNDNSSSMCGTGSEEKAILIHYRYVRRSFRGICETEKNWIVHVSISVGIRNGKRLSVGGIECLCRASELTPYSKFTIHSWLLPIIQIDIMWYIFR